MTVGEIKQELERIRYSESTIQKQPASFMQVVSLACHFYSLGYQHATDDITNELER